MNPATGTSAPRRTFLLLVVCLLAASTGQAAAGRRASASPVKARPRPPAPLYVDLVDQSGPQPTGLDERRRGPIFFRALQDAVRAGKRPPLVCVNPDLSLLAGVDYRAERANVPAGGRLARIYLTRWSKSAGGDALSTEILCRFFVEIFVNGQRTAKLGPFFGRAPLRTYLNPDYRQEWADFAAAARAAAEDFARALPPAAASTGQ